MTYRSIELYYDIENIPGIEDRGAFSGQALEFRNRAMDFIDNALESANAGTWEGAEIGHTEINFGFEVDDFDRAEAVIREAVAGTEYEGFREMRRREMTEADMAEAAQAAADFKMPTQVKLMMFMAIPLALVFLIISLIKLPFRLLKKR